MAEKKTILIKKYENRRLYDATNSRYVNLEDVAQILKRGNDVRVIDAASGEDITRLILTQIIVEDAKAPDSTFPLDVLRQMVIASGRASQESTLKYMKAMLDFYQNTYRMMSGPLNPFEFMQPSSTGRSGTVEAPANETNGASAEAPPERAKKAETEKVDELKARVEELEKLVSSLAQKKSIRKGKSKK